MKQLFIVLLFWTNAALAHNPELEIVTPKKTVKITLSDLKSKLKSHVVEIDDIVYKKKMSFDAFLLSDVFQLAGFGADEAGDEIVYTAKDGYSPNMPFSAMKKHTPYLAYSEHGKHNFGLVDQGKEKISPGPYYVIWSEGAKLGDAEVPWPYQLVKIEAVRFADKFPKILPVGAKENSPEFRGFLAFKAECLRCHSINLQGGDVGPELNIPKNVTEYWKRDILKEFIPNAPSFRAKSKMPAFEKLNVDDVMAYLQYMAKHKQQ
jgi:cytochrome c2